MIVLRLAFRNIMGAGLRTWLNVFVLSAAFVMIIWAQGMIAGMDRTIVTAKIDFEVGGGQYWHRLYDPYDPFTYEESHAALPQALLALVERGVATPMLVMTGSIYPKGRMQPAILCGIDPDQRILKLPAGELAGSGDGAIPVMIGAQLARDTGLRVGDDITVRWRDANGTFDATEVRVRHIIDLTVPGVERGFLWLPLETLRDMLQMPGHASIIVAARDIENPPPGDREWQWRDPEFLLKDVTDLVKMKSAGMYIMYSLMLFMGLLAIFDTQVLAIWRRRREIGTLMALGMERRTVIGLFTTEGALHGLLALGVGAVYGIPILTITLVKGIPVPEAMTDMGMPIPQVLYPVYGAHLVLFTTLLVLLSVTVVSGLPASRIANLKPTDAIRGKLS